MFQRIFILFRTDSQQKEKQSPIIDMHENDIVSFYQIINNLYATRTQSHIHLFHYLYSHSDVQIYFRMILLNI